MNCHYAACIRATRFKRSDYSRRARIYLGNTLFSIIVTFSFRFITNEVIASFMRDCVTRN